MSVTVRFRSRGWGGWWTIADCRLVGRVEETRRGRWQAYAAGSAVALDAVFISRQAAGEALVEIAMAVA